MAHIHEKIDFTATVFVVHKDRVLLRLHDKYKIWIGVGGHIELDEDANTAALREVKEEVGLDVTLVPPPHWKAGGESSLPKGYRELIPPLFLNIHQISETHQHHDLVFAAYSETDNVIPEHPNDTWLWLTERELSEHADIDSSVKAHATACLQIAHTYHS
jgi:8-oxo-dGTP pyrophosphatase MutT (NUDIX family)